MVEEKEVADDIITEYWIICTKCRTKTMYRLYRDWLLGDAGCKHTNDGFIVKKIVRKPRPTKELYGKSREEQID